MLQEARLDHNVLKKSWSHLDSEVLRIYKVNAFLWWLTTHNVYSVTDIYLLNSLCTSIQISRCGMYNTFKLMSVYADLLLQNILQMSHVFSTKWKVAASFRDLLSANVPVVHMYSPSPLCLWARSESTQLYINRCYSCNIYLWFCNQFQFDFVTSFSCV